MTRRRCRGVLVLSLLLVCGQVWRRCHAQVSIDEEARPPGDPAGDPGPFFALRSCQQLLHAEAGEFFSPDYLCSNPPLWCNWTIQVDAGKRVHLHLEDLTPDDMCHFKRDQLHVDEPAGRFKTHRLLQKCWREAKFTSTSNTLYVVLLIAGLPTPPYRGFYARYQAFGPPVVYAPQEGRAESPGVIEEQAESVVLPPALADSDLVYDYYDHRSATAAAADPEDDPDGKVDENLHPASESYTQAYLFTAVPTAPASTQGTARSGRDAPQMNPTSTTPPATQRRVEQFSTRSQESPAPRDKSLVEQDGANGTEADQTLDQLPPPSDQPEPQEPIRLPPNLMEPLSDHRGSKDMKNGSDRPHLPGDHLLEVTVEVNFSLEQEEFWDDIARSLLRSVKTLMVEHLEVAHASVSLSPKRIKRLSVGVLYIIWLQMGRGPGAQGVHTVIQSTLQGLLTAEVAARGNPRKGIIASLSMADVDECGSHLMLCDVNADCVNSFASYLCSCRPGFRDASRLGSGGTVCVDVRAAGCGSGPSAETRGVYVLFFLLSSLILMLLVGAGVLYRRHRRGAFLVHCRGHSAISASDRDNNRCHHHDDDDDYPGPADSDLPPPPPVPARGFREAWPQVKERRLVVDLPLLRFSPLLPPEEGGKM